VDPEEYHGLVREIEDPTGQGMAPFYRALARAAAGQPGAIVRVAHWGDSTIAADDVTVTLRRRLQARFGEGGHGFHLAGRGTQPYRHFDVQWDDFRSWKAQSVIHGDRKDGRYGLGGILQIGNRGSRAEFRTVEKGPVGRTWGVVEVWYQVHPASGPLAVRIDEGEWVSLETRSGTTEDRWFRQEVEDGPPHRLEIEARGPEVRVYGVVMERSGPGVVWDSLGIVGARANRLLHFDPDHLAAQVARRAPDLLVLAFGGNEAADLRMNHDRYRQQLAEVIRRVRAGRPEAGCLLLAPLDQGEVGPRGGVRTLPELPRIVESQRVVAAEAGCAFFDTWKAMGGEGAMGRWYRSRPRLGWGDYRHATPAGYEVVGNLIYKALLKGFADHLAQVPR
jgi:lysophospholipase L1-like esterase